MKQVRFDDITDGIGGVYVPASTDPYYELVGLTVVTGSVNNRIRVVVLDADGEPVYGAWVRHSFGTDYERQQYTGEPVQFNLGAGSHYTEPDDPPDHITIEGNDTDEVCVGNSNLIGFAHTEWYMSFKMTGGAPPPPPGDYITAAQAQAMIDSSLNAAFERAKTN